MCWFGMGADQRPKRRPSGAVQEEWAKIDKDSSGSMDAKELAFLRRQRMGMVGGTSSPRSVWRSD